MNAPYGGFPEGPLRDAWRAGATAEANARDARYSHAPKKVRELLDLVRALVEHNKPEAPVGVLAPTLRIYSSTFTRADRRALRRAIRGAR